jgi:hypothetical protein
MTADVLKVELEPQTARSLLAAKELLSLIQHSGHARGAPGTEDLAGLYGATGPAALRARAMRPDAFAAASSNAEEAPDEATGRRSGPAEAREGGSALRGTQMPPAVTGRREGEPPMAVAHRVRPIGNRRSARRDGETTGDAEAVLAAPEEVDSPPWPGGFLTPAGEAGRDWTGPAAQADDPTPPEAYHEPGLPGRSITVIYGDKIDANNYYGRIIDHANTTAVRGGTTDDME